MKRVLRINGTEYDLENAAVTISVTTDTVVIDVAESPAVESVPAPVAVEDIMTTEILQTTSAARAVEAPMSGLNLSSNGSDGTDRTLQTPEAMRDQPSKMGILPHTATTVKGTTRLLSEQEMKTFDRLRRDFEIKVIDEKETTRLSIAKRNGKPLVDEVVKSPEFTMLTEEEIHQGLLRLAGAENLLVDAADRINFLYVVTPPKLIVLDITDEAQGVGVFQLRETVSVYRNPEDSKRSHPPNGQEAKD